LIHVTEKTLEPLIKGHIILPFSNPGTIARLINMGFKMPAGVDYGFDIITDPQQRFTALTAEFQRLMAQDLPTLYKHNQEIFLHNQACINTIKYDTGILALYNV
jgi:hypothetical protein